MPGFYADGEYDIAGFIVGVVDRARIIDGRRIVPGDVLIGLPSTGLHTNGYSLARRVLFDVVRLDAGHVRAGARRRPSATRCSRRTGRTWRAVQPLLERGLVKGMAHITGGGITENLPRVLPEGCAADDRPAAWPVPPIFTLICRSAGAIADDEMFRAFNMGVGLIVVVRRGRRRRASLDALPSAGEPAASRIGRVVPGERVAFVELTPTVSAVHSSPSRSASSSPAAAATCSRSSTRSRAGALDATIAVVISNRADAAGLLRAREAGIEAICARAHATIPTATPTTGRWPTCSGAATSISSAWPASCAGRRAAARRVSRAHPEHPSVAAAGVSRPRRAAAGARARRARQRRDRASRDRRARRRPDRRCRRRCRCCDDDTVETLAARILVEEHRLYPEAIRARARRALARSTGRRFVRRLIQHAGPGLGRRARRVVQRQDRDFRRAVDPDRHVDRADAAADEDRRRRLCRPKPATTGNFRAATAPTPGSTTWPPCVCPDSTSGIFSAAASVRRRGSCASRITGARGAADDGAMSAARLGPEPDTGELERLVADRQARPRVLQHLDAAAPQRRRHVVIVVVVAEDAEDAVRRRERARALRPTAPTNAPVAPGDVVAAEHDQIRALASSAGVDRRRDIVVRRPSGCGGRRSSARCAGRRAPAAAGDRHGRAA